MTQVWQCDRCGSYDADRFVLTIPAATPTCKTRDLDLCIHCSWEFQEWLDNPSVRESEKK